MIGFMEERRQIQIALTQRAHEAVEGQRARLGMSKVVILSRLVEWFASQSETVQQGVLGVMPRDSSPDVARIILARMAESDQSRPLERTQAEAQARIEAIGRQGLAEATRKQSHRRSGSGAA